MARIINQPLRAKYAAVACVPSILLAYASAEKPHTAFPSVRSVGMIAIFFTVLFSAFCGGVYAKPVLVQATQDKHTAIMAGNPGDKQRTCEVSRHAVAPPLAKNYVPCSQPVM